jgi:Tfp pilus assembly protein PilO
MNRFAGTMTALRYSLRCPAVKRGTYAVLLALVMFLGVALGWWGPAKREATSLEQALDENRAAAVQALRMAEIAHVHDDALRTVAKLENKLTVAASQADLIQGVAKLAVQHGVRVIAQSFDEGRGQHNDSALYMELGLAGSYPALRGMINDLATLPMWTEVVEARLDHSGENSAPVRAQLRLLTLRTPKGRA